MQNIKLIILLLILSSCKPVQWINRGIDESNLMYYKTHIARIDSTREKKYETRYYVHSVPGRIYWFDYYKNIGNIGDTIRLTFAIKERIHIKQLPK